jgi:hypothetical protein
MPVISIHPSPRNWKNEPDAGDDQADQIIGISMNTLPSWTVVM